MKIAAIQRIELVGKDLTGLRHSQSHQYVLSKIVFHKMGFIILFFFPELF